MSDVEPATVQGPRQGSRKWLWTALALTLFTALVYANTLDNGFVWDDEHLILLDQRHTDGQSFAKYFVGDFFAHRLEEAHYGYYRPLVSLSYGLDTAISGLMPAGFHLTNLVLHIGCVLLVWALGLRLFRGERSWAAAGAALFAVHPIHTESVAWISGRTDVLATLFFLAALNLHARLGGPSRRKDLGAVALACLCFMAALLCKEVALSLPLVVLIWERVYSRRSWGLSMRRVLPYVAVLGAYGILRFLMYSVTTNPPPSRLFHVWLLTAAKGFWIYLGELFWPVPMVAFHRTPWMAQYDWTWLATIGATVLAIGLGFYVRRHRRIGFLSLAFAASLIPMANIIRITSPAEVGFPIAERFAYLPSVFFCLATGQLLLRKASYRRAGLAVLAVLLVLGSIATVDRNDDWQDNHSFLTATLEQAPDSAHFIGLMATIQIRKGNLDEAERLYRLALSTHRRMTGSDNPVFVTGLALTLVQAGKHRDALLLTKPLERVFPEVAAISYVVGEAHRKMGHIDQAEAAFVRSLAAQKDYLPSRVGLAQIASDRGDHERALGLYRTILSLQSDHAIVHEAMGDLHRRMGRLDEAIAAFERALVLNPANPTAHTALGSIAAMQRDFDQAERLYTRAMELDPDFHQAAISLAMIQAERGRPVEAEKAMLAVLAADEDNAAGLLNLGILYAQMGQLSKARHLLTRLLASQPTHARALAVLHRIDAAASVRP
jgi:tetratricopeptide (TPR) repeat protein